MRLFDNALAQDPTTRILHFLGRFRARVVAHATTNPLRTISHFRARDRAGRHPRHMFRMSCMARNAKHMFRMSCMARNAKHMFCMSDQTHVGLLKNTNVCSENTCFVCRRNAWDVYRDMQNICLPCGGQKRKTGAPATPHGHATPNWPDEALARTPRKPKHGKPTVGAEPGARHQSVRCRNTLGTNVPPVPVNVCLGQAGTSTSKPLMLTLGCCF